MTALAAKNFMRLLLQRCLLLGGWGSFALLWFHALADRAQCRLLAVCVLVAWGLIALATTIWVAHLLSIALQKSPRLQHPMAVALYVRDRLGRPVHAPWPDLRQLQCISIKLDAATKHYQAGIGPLPGTPAGGQDVRAP